MINKALLCCYAKIKGIRHFYGSAKPCFAKTLLYLPDIKPNENDNKQNVKTQRK